MRLLIKGTIINKFNILKTDYTHSTYAFILNNIKSDIADSFHYKHNQKNKRTNFLCFTNLYIDRCKKNFHFYLTSDEDLARSLQCNLKRNTVQRLEDMIIKIENIFHLPELGKKPIYFFKTDLIVKDRIHKSPLSTNFEYIKKELKNIALYKASISKEKITNKHILIKRIVNPIRKAIPYKKATIPSWKCVLEVEGDYELINFIYSVTGFGENTTTAHGFPWEV